jgi:carboxyl-terminal processing protease
LDAPRECRIPAEAWTRQDGLRVQFSVEGGEAPADSELRPTVNALLPPTFAYSYQIADDRNGNGDGQVSRGEGVTVYLDVQNTGKGPSRETQALVRNLSGDGLFLHAGRFDISGMKPGERRQVAFTFDVGSELKENLAKVEVSVVDRDMRVSVSDKISIPVVAGGFFIKEVRGLTEVNTRAFVRAQPLMVAPMLGTLELGSKVNKLGEFGEFAKVSLGKGGRTGFVENSALKAASGAEDVKFEPLVSHSPPLLELDVGGLSTRGATAVIKGIAKDSDQVRDAYIFVGSRKVFYKSNRNGADPKQMAFEHEFPLQPGVNIVTVVARENDDVATARTVVVRRDGPNGEVLPTPKRDLFGEDWSFADDDQ